ncbi:zinc finger BED domain-containing protein RICESLEEPER 2-like [Ricinus communis]|uniref:zinc finger BED domain-containing protein RICESLEEPER 2-like n=1 Tax=Ricinus communis TaxID=3988 RepID=UPI00201B271E|nr:zinc finger BED domain-containing protein RICESLEEPER 2-like [Ricinus communis]
MDSLSQFSLKNKISSVVVDNCTTNDDMINVLLEKLESSCLVLNGDFLHMRCSAHILNLIVKDGLEAIDHAIVKVRECIAFWMSTPKRIEKFEEACRLLNVTKTKRVGLDCKTRWNSTYLMLESSFPFKDVFNKLKRLNKRLKFSVPSDNDWTMATLVCQKLEIFYKATKVFSIRNHPTTNLFFRIVCEIRLALNRWVQTDNHEVIRTMAKSMVEKFDKYWSHINGILAIAAILDPRNKMDCVAHYFGKLYGDDANSEMTRMRKTLDNLVHEFQNKNEVVNEPSPLK